MGIHVSRAVPTSISQSNGRVKLRVHLRMWLNEVNNGSNEVNNGSIEVNMGLWVALLALFGTV